MTLVRAMLVVVLAVALAPAAGAHPHHARATRAFRVCADPNNLPFTNARQEGFENRIADLLARQLGATVEYTWWAERRGFFRNTLKAGTCDVVIGVPVGIELARTTRPYYRSSYVFVSRADRGLDITSLDDDRLRTLKVGVQLIGDDGASSPPVHALSRRGIVDNVVGYSVYGDYNEDSPPADVVRAVIDGEVDVAIAWGPMAGAFAKTSGQDLVVAPVAEAEDDGLPMAFDIALGVRKDDAALAAKLDRLIARDGVAIRKILDEFGVPWSAPVATTAARAEDDD